MLNKSGSKNTYRKENTFGRTEEVEDIIDRMPDRSGSLVTLFAVFLFLALMLFGYLIKYPEVISGNLVLNANVAPIKLVSNFSGNLIINDIKTKDKVKAGDYIAYIRSAAVPKNVITIKNLLNRLDISNLSSVSKDLFPKDVKLGELNEYYFNFLNAFYGISNHFNKNLYDRQRLILEKQLKAQEKVISVGLMDRQLASSAFELAGKRYKRDSILHNKKVLSLSDLEISKSQLLNVQRNFQALQNTISSAEYELEDVLNKLQQLKIQVADDQSNLDIKASAAYYQLLESIRQWEIKYAVVSPIDGILEFANFWNNGDYVLTGQELFTVIPSQKDVYAQVYLPEKGAGKVEIGQKVVIKLNDFPYAEYGSLVGIVRDISLMTNQSSGADSNKESLYRLKVDLKQGLKTNYGTILKIKFGAKGIAEIITKDRRLYERFFDALKYQTKK